jgi:hypothetical protein
MQTMIYTHVLNKGGPEESAVQPDTHYVEELRD